MSDGRAFVRPPAEPFGIGDPIPANGDGERHPDVIRFRHELSDYAAARLAYAGDYAALAKHLGGEWTAKRLKAAHAYIKGHGSAPS